MNLDKLRGLRVEHGLTQKNIAEKIGINLSTYTLKENGKRDFTASEISKLCEIFNVKSSIFFDNWVEKNTTRKGDLYVIKWRKRRIRKIKKRCSS